MTYWTSDSGKYCPLSSWCRAEDIMHIY